MSQLLSSQERKKASGRYLTRARALRENINSNTLLNLNDLVDRQDDLMEKTSIEEKIENQVEIIIDSEIITCASKIIEHCTITLTKENNTYNSDEYADMIHDYVMQRSDTIPDDSEDMNWHTMEVEIEALFKKTPYFSTLSGALEPLPKKPVAKRGPIVRDAQAAIKKPENVITTEKDDQSVEETVEKIRKLLTRHHKTYHQPLDYFRFVLHPTDFGLTIENILHVSFLVRDGIVQLKKDNRTGALMIEHCTKDMIAQAKKMGKSCSVQNILPLNPKQWQVLVNHYGIKEPMINFHSDGQ